MSDNNSASLNSSPVFLTGWNLENWNGRAGFPVYVVNQTNSQANRDDQDREFRKIITDDLPSNIRISTIAGGWVLCAVDTNGRAVGLTFVPFSHSQSEPAQNGAPA
jgi:hypothetical protein